uniref:Uncharacterized protein n=1 Tax=Rhipicephalus microplus TaxID=6941 RepID=A0A6G5AIU5_RHIMP
MTNPATSATFMFGCLSPLVLRDQATSERLFLPGKPPACVYPNLRNVLWLRLRRTSSDQRTECDVPAWAGNQGRWFLPWRRLLSRLERRHERRRIQGIPAAATAATVSHHATAAVPVYRATPATGN